MTRPQPVPEWEELEALDEPDVPYAAALAEVLPALVGKLATPHPRPVLGWLGPAGRAATRLQREYAGLGDWHSLPFTPSKTGVRLPQPPGRTLDLLVLGFALSTSGERLGAVLGYALRTLRDVTATSRLLVLERVHAPLDRFVRDVQTRLHPGDTHRPSAVAPVPMDARLAWHAKWSPYTPADVAWACAAYGVMLDEPTPPALGNGRRYLLAPARPALQSPVDRQT